MAAVRHGVLPADRAGPTQTPTAAVPWRMVTALEVILAVAAIVLDLLVPTLVLLVPATLFPALRPVGPGMAT